MEGNLIIADGLELNPAGKRSPFEFYKYREMIRWKSTLAYIRQYCISKDGE